MLFTQKNYIVPRCRCLAAAVFLLLALPCSGMDFYLWQRSHTQEVKAAVKEFYANSNGKLYCIAGELEGSGKVVSIKPSDAISLDRSVAVIRIQTDAVKDYYNFPIANAREIIKKIVKLYLPWKQCQALEIDLDIPESKIDFYADLIMQLRENLPGVTLSATVLPCHLSHRQEFSRLASACDFYVLQVHGLNKDNGYWLIFDYSDSVKAVEKAKSFKRSFKVALPLYCNNIDRSTLVKPDLQKVSDLAKISPQVIGFRLGLSGDGNALDWQTAAALCRGESYRPKLQMQWQLQGNGAWILSVKNVGCFSENITLEIPGDLQKIMEDADAFNDAFFDRHNNIVKFRLPPSGETVKIMWARFSENPNKKSSIIIKEN